MKCFEIHPYKQQIAWVVWHGMRKNIIQFVNGLQSSGWVLLANQCYALNMRFFSQHIMSFVTNDIPLEVALTAKERYGYFLYDSDPSHYKRSFVVKTTHQCTLHYTLIQASFKRNRASGHPKWWRIYYIWIDTCTKRWYISEYVLWYELFLCMEQLSSWIHVNK